MVTRATRVTGGKKSEFVEILFAREDCVKLAKTMGRKNATNDDSVE
jgi:hypothetical protein